ncbi:hypothetical protein DSM112329_02319 [Paraconexibacter sp. AEG42_29]|uniref:Uncharacterized protein n=1 Tax=Paraconexibacter sp. AEG42_29 TaxID=2997339 RepID=A0AAU7AV03_9ACTN
MRPTLLFALIACVAGGVMPSGAAASTVPERRAAAQAATRITFGFARERSAADPRARAAARARRAAAGTCLDVWQSAPKARIRVLGEIYFSSVAGARWSVDGPLVVRWITRMAASRAVMRVPVLASAVRAVRRATPTLTGAFSEFPDPCATVTAWRDAGWSAAAEPKQADELLAAGASFEAAAPAISRGRAFIRRYGGPSGANAGDLFDGALDEPDGQVIDDCDPVARIVLPDNVEACDRGR